MINLKITLKYTIAFYCITMLYMSLHELVHHFIAFLVCGEFGYKSFNSFDAACESDYVYLFATLSGPVFSYIMMYWGAYFIQKGKTLFKRHLGFAMVFAQLPMQRMTGPLMNMNDEWYAVVKLWGNSDTLWWIVIILIWSICIPPLIVAWRAIQNKFKAIWFAFYFLFFPYLVCGPIFFLLEYLMLEKDILSQTFIGIGALFILNELVTIVAYLFLKKYIDPAQNKLN